MAIRVEPPIDPDLLMDFFQKNLERVSDLRRRRPEYPVQRTVDRETACSAMEAMAANVVAFSLGMIGRGDYVSMTEDLLEILARSLCSDVLGAP